MSAASYSLDTSVVIRLLTGQPEDQFNRALTFLEEARNAGHRIYVEDLVLAETYYALQAYYRMPKDKALAALYQFSETSGASFSEAAKTILKIPNLGSARPGFVDRLIHSAGHARNHKLVTFEKAAQKLPHTELLK